MEKPLTIDLYCGLGGWSEGFISEGYEVIGFDIERHDYGTGGYPGQLVLQDVMTLHGSQFKDAAVIVASPPCQAYSYRAMPWKRAKALPPPDNTLFETCFRIQREANKAVLCSCGHEHQLHYLFKGAGYCHGCAFCECKDFDGKFIPLIVENVRGAQKWVGRAKWHFGSYYLWGDVPALMPITLAPRLKFNPDGTEHGPGSWFKIADSKKRGSRSGHKGTGGSWFTPGEADRTPGHWKESGCVTRRYNSKDVRRAAAAAAIAKIPFPLAQHIAKCFKPEANAQIAGLGPTGVTQKAE
jgi:hypothetical protein